MNEVRQFVYEEDEPQRLDLFLCSILECSRSEAGRLIQSGAVEAERGKVKSSRLCRLHDRFTVSLPEPEPTTIQPEPMDLKFWHVDDQIAVVEKPAGVAVHPGAGRCSGTLVNGLMACFPQLSGFGATLRPGIVHRLDLGTSGVMVVALTQQSALNLSNQFAQRTTKKLYYGLVHGTFKYENGTMDAPIGRDPRQPLRMIARDDGKEARTLYEVIWKSENLSLARFHILTGRTHQIRVHLKSLGLYLDGDRLYGPLQDDGHYLRDRVFLHAHQLELDHPITGERMAFYSPLPQELQQLETNLRPEKSDVS